MTVIRPNSISGINSITGSGGDISIFRADGTAADLIVNNVTTGVVTATTFVGGHSGNGANLTNLPAANLTGALPSISAANLTSIPAANITGTLPAISAANLTNVPAANITGTLPAIDGSALTGVGVGTADSINTSGIITATAFVPSEPGGLSHRNIIVNGAMLINQRGSSSTSDNYQTVDRFAAWNNSVNEAPTQSYFDVVAPAQYHLPMTGPHPFKEGFRRAFGVTNGNQTSGAQAGSRIFLTHSVEAKNIANSGWDYTSPSSFITLSFWVKSSVAGNFYGYLYNFDGTNLAYSYETGNLSQFTWTKVTKTIPGHASLQFDNNSDQGMWIVFGVYWGTNYTDAGNTLNQWATWNSSSRTPVNATNWFTTDNASFQITGVQLEVGSVATPFEHRGYDEELRRCQRYYQKDTSRNRRFWGSGNVSGRQFPVRFDVEMRDTPSVSFPSSSIDSGSLSANGINKQGYYTNMSGSGRFYEWQHIANAEIN